MSMKKQIGILITVALLILAGYFLYMAYNGNQKEEADKPPMSEGIAISEARQMFTSNGGDLEFTNIDVEDTGTSYCVSINAATGKQLFYEAFDKQTGDILWAYIANDSEHVFVTTVVAPKTVVSEDKALILCNEYLQNNGDSLKDVPKTRKTELIEKSNGVLYYKISYYISGDTDNCMTIEVNSVTGKAEVVWNNFSTDNQ